jgi:hypothetical protein
MTFGRRAGRPEALCSGWPYHTYSKPLRLLAPFNSVKMERGRIFFQTG